MILFRKMSCSKMAPVGVLRDPFGVLSDPSGVLGLTRFPHLPSVLGVVAKHEPIFWAAIAALRKVADSHVGPSHLCNARDALLAAAAAVGRLSVSEEGTTKKEVEAAIAAVWMAATPLNETGFRPVVLRAAGALLAIYEVVAAQHDARAIHYRALDARRQVELLRFLVESEETALAASRIRVLGAARRLTDHEAKYGDAYRSELLRGILNQEAIKNGETFNMLTSLKVDLAKAEAELAEARRVVEELRAANRPSEEEVAREAGFREELQRRLRTPPPVSAPVSPAIAVAIPAGEEGVEGLPVAVATDMPYNGEAIAAPARTGLNAGARPFIPQARRTAVASNPPQ